MVQLGWKMRSGWPTVRRKKRCAMGRANGWVSRGGMVLGGGSNAMLFSSPGCASIGGKIARRGNGGNGGNGGKVREERGSHGEGRAVARCASAASPFGLTCLGWWPIGSAGSAMVGSSPRRDYPPPGPQVGCPLGPDMHTRTG